MCDDEDYCYYATKLVLKEINIIWDNMKFVISAHRTRVIRERESEFEKIRKNRERFANIIIVIGMQKRKWQSKSYHDERKTQK